MITEADLTNWSVDPLRQYVQVLASAFGFDRLMFGNDWPVCKLAGSYKEVLDSTREALGPPSADLSKRFWGANASRFYSLRYITTFRKGRRDRARRPRQDFATTLTYAPAMRTASAGTPSPFDVGLDSPAAQVSLSNSL